MVEETLEQMQARHKREMRAIDRQELIGLLLTFGGAVILMIAFVLWLLPEALEREANFRDQLWHDRCARWGTLIRPEMKPYCNDNLGI